MCAQPSIIPARFSSPVGDQVANTWWRIQNGEFPAVAPKLAVIWLGTNDLSTIDAGCGYSQDALSADAPGVVDRYALRRFPSL